MPDDLKALRCGAKTRAGTPCKQKAIYINGRCKWHGGLSTGAKTEEGKKRSALDGFWATNLKRGKYQDLTVRPEPVEGWTVKPLRFDKLTTNGLTSGCPGLVGSRILP